MTCAEQMAELVECARRRWEPGSDLRAHLAQCDKCSERWEVERRLTDQFRTMRVRGIALMAEDTHRDVLMRDFVEMHRRRAVRSWVFALTAAAALAAVILVGHVAGVRMRRVSPPAVRTHEVRNTQAVFYEVSTDASALSSDDFIAVPYTPPLAQGELVRMVHADLHPEALASMGIDVDPEWMGDIPVDVVVGEDGLPRAVRITENATDDF